MAYKMLLVFFCVIALATSEEKGRRNGRKSRFISLDTSKNDVQVNLDFTVPFLSIPIKQTVDSVIHGLPGFAIPQINLNPTALVFGGFIIVASSVLLPLLSKGLSGLGTDGTTPYYRVLDNTNEETNLFMDLSNQFLNLSRGCPMRMACWMSQESYDMQSTQIIEQIIRNKLVSSIIDTTSLEEAIANGRRGRDCATYEPCPLEQRHLMRIMKNFSSLSRRNFT